MTIEALLIKINRGLRAGHFTELDSVFVRDPDVSEGAMEAGSNGWAEADEFVIMEGNDLLQDGIYLSVGER